MSLNARRLGFLALAAGAVAAVGLVLLYALAPPPSTAPNKTVTTASVGGPFELVDQYGETVTDADFRGRLMLVYFGYTYCPDVCPIGLTVISQAFDILGEEADEVVPIFITVDPERDTVPVLAEYVENFHPRLVGLTGTPEAVTDATAAYRVYAAKVAPDGGAVAADSDDYLMDHSAYTYLMDRDGAFLELFSHGTDAEEMAARIRAHL